MSKTNRKLDGELNFWINLGLHAGMADRAKWLKSEAAYIKGMIHRAARVPLRPGHKVLQIAAGPCDVIDFWGDAEKHAIDPLAEQYRERFHELQNPTVKYVAGYGEDLPYRDDYFDVVIIRNGLDHLNDPDKALQEVFRVIKSTGVLYLWMYMYSWRASLVYRAINALTKRYIGEPWAFTFRRTKKTIRKNGFIAYMPAVEDRRERLSPPTNSSIYPWLKYLAKLALDFTHGQGFTCVALPDKEKQEAPE